MKPEHKELVERLEAGCMCHRGRHGNYCLPCEAADAITELSVERTCVWTPVFTADADGWFTGCGKGAPLLRRENAICCHYCGGRIVEARP